MCDELAGEVELADELERLKSVRRRSTAASESLSDAMDLITRLDSSGIGRSEIPVVLRALGHELDVDIAVELMHLLGFPGSAPALVQEPAQPGDRLSLLYVAGKHYGVEPDYQLALGQMPIDEIIELRLLVGLEIPPRRFAEILAVAETAKLAVRARLIDTLSLTEYTATAEQESRRFGSPIRGIDESWPVAASNLRRRLGRGYWDQALNEVGLELHAARDRFGEHGYTQALLDYTRECRGSNLPLSIEDYDRWVMGEASVRRDRPSAVELVAKFGSWKSALRRSQNASNYQAKNQDWDSHFPLNDGALFGCVNSSEQAVWVRAGEYICELLASLPLNRSLQIQYGDSVDGSIQPHAEGTRGADGVWCEVVSERFLPGEQWPIDTGYLEDGDWLAPDDEFPQWCKEAVPLQDAGHQLLEGLRLGRLCPDPWQLRWSTKEPLSGPVRDHGVTIEQALAGAVQTLRNAG